MARQKHIYTAVGLSPAQRDACVQLVERMKKSIQFLRNKPDWVAPERLHIILNYLGDQDSETVEKLIPHLEETISAFNAFTFSLRGVEPYPSARKPELIRSPVDAGKNALGGLKVRVEMGLEDLGFPASKKVEIPALTLGQIKGTQDSQDLVDILKSHGEAELGSAKLNNLMLLQQVQTEKGPFFKVLHRWLLQSSPSG